MKKRLLSILLTALLLCAVPLVLVDTAYADLGTCGDNVTWSLSDDGTLTISGTGRMQNYESYGAPWFGFYSQVKTVVIENGVTSIGDYAFTGCTSLTGVTIPDSVVRIGGGAFWATRLTSVTIPSSVTSIGSAAFGMCGVLTDIYYDGYGVDWLAAGGAYARVPENTTVHFKEELYGRGACGENVNWVMTLDGTLTISGTGEMADYSGSDNFVPWAAAQEYIQSVVIESGVTSIGDGAFYGCTVLTDVTIPGSVTDIGGSAFEDCTGLTRVVLPHGVTSIGMYAFDRCSSLTDVTIPASVTMIGNGAFRGCSRLSGVTIPDSVTGIGSYAFYNCGSLTSVTIPDGVTSIEYNTFYACKSLTSVTIPSGVTKIGDNAFYGCDALTDIYYGGYGIDWLKAGCGHDRAPENATVHFKDDLYGKGACGENVDWVMTADGILTISGTGAMADCEWNSAPWARACSEITSIVIGDGVTSIGNNAFQYCSSLTGAAIPGSVTAIGSSVFYGCDALTDIYYGGYGIDWLATAGHNEVPDGTAVHFKDDLYGKGACGENVNWVMTADGMLTISGTGAMTDCDSFGAPAPWEICRQYIKSAVIESGVTSIGKYVFYRCEALTSVTIPDTVTVIGDGAFRGCSRLSGVTIPDSVTGIGIYAFYNCSSLTSVTIPDGVTTISESAFEGCIRLSSVTIPGSVTSIGKSAFRDCCKLTGVTIPDSVTSIGDSAFNGCNGLTSVTLPDSVISIGKSAFRDCCKLTGVTIPDSVTSIGDSAFNGCNSLTSVTIPDSVTRISAGMFYNCWSLSNVTIPNGVTSIGDSAFGVCTDLSSVTIPASVTTIGRDAFFVCSSLTSVTIPASVTSIRSDAFYYCDSLTDVYYDGTAEDWAKIFIGDGNEDLTNATLHCVPSAPVVKIGHSAASGKPQLMWNAVEGATSYRIYRSTAKGSGYSLLGTTTATSYTNTGAKAGTTYYYRVKAVNDARLSPYSNIVSGQVKTVTPKPSAPVVKIGNSSTSGKPMLTWNAVSGATSYKVYRATAQNGTYSLLGTVTATSYTNTGAKAGTTYYYKVKAVNSAGESAYSNIVSGQATITTLTMGHSASSGKPQLTWKAVSGAASYKVYRATSKTGAYSVINTTSALTYTNTGAALGTTYYYKVEALNSAGKSMGFSAVVEGKVAPVLAVGYSSVSGKPQLTWKAVPGATEYQVYRSTQQNSGYSKINTTTSTSYVNTGAKAGTTYYYKIVAVKGTSASDFSNTVTARPGK